MQKFFVPEADLRGERISLSGSHGEHLRVLRVRPGEELILSDGKGKEARCVVETAGKADFELRILEWTAATGEADVCVTVYAAYPKGDKAELIVQKAVELGAASIVFFLSERCVARPDERSAAGKADRLGKIAEAAAMQSGRGRIPEVRWIPKYADMLSEASKTQVAAFFWEEARDLSFRSLLTSKMPFESAALITGPEGGFSAREAEQAVSAGIPAVTLGKRILRCETAPLCALTALMYETGNMD